MSMELEVLFKEIQDFCKLTHGSSDYDKDLFFVMGEDPREFAPVKYLERKWRLKFPEKNFKAELQKLGLILIFYSLQECEHFKPWFEKQFSTKLDSKKIRDICILYRPKHKLIFNALQSVHQAYNTLRHEYILINSKNLPVQLGEWYAKSIFGLRQIKSTSQRGFDFYHQNSRVEVKIHWSDVSSPKGVKIKRSMVELSDFCIILYVTLNFMIREICVLDSAFVMRKFATKGHTIFLKDQDISSYFFSKSSKQFDKVISQSSLLSFAGPQLALKLEGRLPESESFKRDHSAKDDNLNSHS
jgi:hypothetical protein